MLDNAHFENASSIHPKHHLTSDQSLLSSEHQAVYGWSEGDPQSKALRPSSKHNLNEMLQQQKQLLKQSQSHQVLDPYTGNLNSIDESMERGDHPEYSLVEQSEMFPADGTLLEDGSFGSSK
mmetsp:Transcript_42339/g.64959  ORF Transcript_42339/g.64959 Transcript_42339/m.64959 type:complete len:122 (+) Transcript_42339:599-964(+)